MDNVEHHQKLELEDHSYPARLNIDYPEKLCRISTFFRLIYLIPIVFLIMLLSGIGTWFDQEGNISDFSVGAGALILPPLIMLVLRHKYPKWWFDWNLAFTRFNTRIVSYAFLLRDEYPSTDEEQAVHLDIDYPDAKKLDRWLPLVKWFLAIPHLFILGILGLGVAICVIVAWFAILITGKYPRSLFDFVVGVLRWALRVNAYAFLLVTDKYPPFSLKP